MPTRMRREIAEQPAALARTLAGLDPAGAVGPRPPRRLILLGSGTSRHAAELAARLARGLGLPAEARAAGDPGPFAPPPGPGDLAVVVSQSGESADALAALAALPAGVRAVAVTNAAASALARAAHAALVTPAGPEHALAATKTHTAQILALWLLVLHAARPAPPVMRRHRLAAGALPGALAGWLHDRAGSAAALGRRMAAAPGPVLLVAAEPEVPVAREGALKLQECAGIPALALAASELPHGPAAVAGPGALTVGVDGAGTGPADLCEALAAAAARGAATVTLAPGPALPGRCPVARLPHPLGPVAAVVALQVAAEAAAVARGRDPDHPRGLVKALTPGSGPAAPTGGPGAPARAAAGCRP